MGDKNPKEEMAPQLKMEILMQEMLSAQLTLEERASATSKFLRFALLVANENLEGIKTQLEKIQDLANAIDDCDCAS